MQSTLSTLLVLISTLWACGRHDLQPMPFNVTVFLVESPASEVVEDDRSSSIADRLFAPRLHDCIECGTVAFVSPAGVRVTVHPEPQPRLVFSSMDIRSASILEVPALTGNFSEWYVVVALNDRTMEQMVDLAREYPADSVVVEVDGRPTDTHLIALWGSGIRLAAFRDQESARRFTQLLGLSATSIPAVVGQVEQDRERWRNVMLEAQRSP